MQIEIGEQRTESVRIAEFAVGKTLFPNVPAIGKWIEGKFAFARERCGIYAGGMNALGGDRSFRRGVKN
jgi:hypothetical protein